MATFLSNVPDIAVTITLDQVMLIPAVQSISLSGSRLEARVGDDLSEYEYLKISKQIRVLYSFCFDQVYSEDCEMRTTSMNYGYSGHNERKEHLLAENSPVLETSGSTCKQLFQDISAVRLSQVKQQAFFNAAFIWDRANELQELMLLSEAYTQYWRLLDMVRAKSQLTQTEVSDLMAQYGVEQNRTNVFAIRVLHEMGLLRENGHSTNIESLALLDSLRHPHAHQAGGRSDYYMEDETHLQAWTHNFFISDIAKLFVIWELGLSDYYLKPKANIYEIAKRIE